MAPRKNLYPFPVALMALLPFFVLGCGRGAPPPELSSSIVSGPGAPSPTSLTPNPAPIVPSRGKAFPLLGVEMGGELIPIENGQRLSLKNTQRLPLRNGQAVEVLVVPFPPSPNTDLHLFLFRGEAPVAGAEVEVTYDMAIMSHGSVHQIAREVDAGHYVMSLEFLAMYGDWAADVVINYPEFNADFRVLLGVHPSVRKTP